jgi:predicted  nucleic acid-binding Zn-ribbon protein
MSTDEKIKKLYERMAVVKQETDVETLPKGKSISKEELDKLKKLMHSVRGDVEDYAKEATA